jgi:hypothetical protein
MIFTPQTLLNKYYPGSLPNNQITVYNYTPKKSTVIVYENPLPISNNDISGMWIVSDKLVKIQATYDSGGISLKSNIIDIKVKSIESDGPFTLTGYSIPGIDTKVQEFGYLTATEYVKNPFGIRDCSYYCIFSDAINKKCTHPTTAYRKHFILDGESIGCKHTPEYDATIDESLRCPGVDAHIVNPFMLQVD